MKHTFAPSNLLVIAAPLYALTMICSAQTLAPTPPAVVAPSLVSQPGINAIGTINAVDVNGLSLRSVDGGVTEFVTNAQTEFMDMEGHAAAPERITRNTPVTIFYIPSGNTFVATKVITTGPLTSAGTLSEVSPGVIVIEMPGASSTPVHYINNTTTNYVDQNGDPVPPQAVRPGAPVRVYYTKVGDTLLASKIEVLGLNAAGQPKTPVIIETTKTTTTVRKSNPSRTARVLWSASTLLMVDYPDTALLEHLSESGFRQHLS